MPARGSAASFPKSKIPKTLGACADRLMKLRELKRKAQDKVDDLEAERKAIEAFVIDKLPKSEATGVSGKVGRVRVVTKTIPQIKDADKFYRYVSRNKRFDMLQRRLSTGAVNEVLEAGKKIPGIDTFDAVSISLTKA